MQRRGCLGINDPFPRNSYGVYHLTPAHCSSFHSFPHLRITHFTLDECSSDEHCPRWTGIPCTMTYSPVVPNAPSSQRSAQSFSRVTACLRGAGVCLLEFHTAAAHAAIPTFSQSVTRPDAPNCLRRYFMEK